MDTHAYVLMDNHFHVLIRTLLGSLIHAIRWMNVTYGIGVEAQGEWSRDGVMFVAVRFARYRLPEVVGEILGV